MASAGYRIASLLVIPQRPHHSAAAAALEPLRDRMIVHLSPTPTCHLPQSGAQTKSPAEVGQVPRGSGNPENTPRIHHPITTEETMRAIPDADAVRNAFHAVLNALPEDKLRTLILELLLAGLTPPAPLARQRKVGRPRKSVEEENVVPVHRHARRRRGRAVDEAKLAERRKRYAATRKAKRQAAKAAKAIKAAAPAAAGNGQDAAVTPQAFWQHAEKLEPTRPWLAVTREFDVKEAIAQNCYRKLSLPPHVGPMAISQFLTLQTPN
jgi:hypothetical protein